MQTPKCPPSTEKETAIMKFPEFTSIDFSKLDINALRKIDLSKYVPDIDLPAVATEKVVSRLARRPARPPARLASTHCAAPLKPT